MTLYEICKDYSFIKRADIAALQQQMQKQDEIIQELWKNIEYLNNLIAKLYTR